MASINRMVNEWFKFAREDLSDAKALWSLKGLESSRTIAFLCQQSTEKSIKGFLQYLGVKIIKTHSLVELIPPILKLHPELNTLLLEAEKLTPYAVEYRYPHATGISLAKEDIDKALQTAEKIYAELTARVSPAGSLV